MNYAWYVLRHEKQAWGLVVLSDRFSPTMTWTMPWMDRSTRSYWATSVKFTISSVSIPLVPSWIEGRLNLCLDSVLQSGVQRVDDALYELDSTMQAGNQNASPAYVLSQIEKASSTAMEFSTAFNNFIADGPSSTHAEIIRTVNAFSGSIADVLGNAKGLTRFATDDKKADQLIGAARQSAQATVTFFRSIQSFRLDGLEPLQKTDVVINNNNEVQINLQKLSKLADVFAPRSGKITNTSGDLGELVDRELTNAAAAIDAATERLTRLMKKPKEGSHSTYELRIHEYVIILMLFLFPPDKDRWCSRRRPLVLSSKLPSR